MMLKKTLMVNLAFGFLLLSPLAITVNAQTEESTTTEPTTATGVQTLDSASTPEERRARRLGESSSPVDQERASRTADRCEAAQEKILTAIDRVSTAVSGRLEKYDGMTSRIQTVIDRLDAAGIDTATLATQLETFEAIIAEFSANYDLYEQALDDAAYINCTDDAEGFLLALDEARDLRTDLVSSVAGIRSHVRDAIIQTLNEIKDSLGSDASADEQGV